MQIAVPEMNKKVGVCYAVTEDGIELPVIDVTHPAFAIEISQDELDGLLQKHIRSVKSQSKLSAAVQPVLMRLLAKRSIIMRGIVDAAGGFMSGLNTYILKLGPDNLGRGYAGEVDRKISGSLSGLSMRLRLQDVAHLLADGVVPALATDRKNDLHLLNIGGGPAIDSLNALILIQKEHPELLVRRQIFIDSLDLDEAGPSFGKRALSALQAEGAPLQGLDISFQHIKYDWSHVSVLRELPHSFNGKAVVAASSEGALFEYGSDEEIMENLLALRDGAPPKTIIAGSLTRADATGRLLNTSSRAALHLRPTKAFTDLIERAGWRVAQSIDRPISHNLRLMRS
jgi:hypothetical protein